MSDESQYGATVAIVSNGQPDSRDIFEAMTRMWRQATETDAQLRLKKGVELDWKTLQTYYQPDNDDPDRLLLAWKATSMEAISE